MIKPSNFKSLLNNKIKKGKLISEIEIFLTDQGVLKDFIARGNVKDFKVELINGLNFSKANFSFGDKSDILIKNIFGELEDIKISEGDIKLNFDEGIKPSNFNSKLNFDELLLNKYSNFLDKNKYTNYIKSFKADLDINFSIELDSTYKVNNFDYKISGLINEGKIEIQNPIKNSFLVEEIKQVFFSDLQITTNFKPKKN